MPEGLGKWERKLYNKTPAWFQRFWAKYHVTIKQAFFVMIFVAIAVVGVEARNAQQDADKAREDITVIKQSSYCLRSEEKPSNQILLQKCRQSARAFAERISDETACRLVERGAALLIINGQRIRGEFRCVTPGSNRPRSQKLPKGDSTTGAIRGPEDRDDNGSGAKEPIEGEDTTGSTQQPQTGGNKGDEQPSNGGNGKSDPSEDPETSSPGAGGGAPVPVPSSSNGTPTPGEPEPTPTQPDPNDPSLVEAIVDGVNDIGKAATKEVCKLNPLGIRVCVEVGL